MLSTRFPARRAVARRPPRRRRCSRSRLRHRPGWRATDGIAVDPEPAGARWRCSCPTARATRGATQIARSLENAARLAQADLRNATIDLAVYPTAGTTAGGAAAAPQAVAEGAKIIVGPLFSTETAGAQPVAAARPG